MVETHADDADGVGDGLVLRKAVADVEARVGGDDGHVLMAEAKKRNPAVKMYGLSWAVPGWIGDGCKSCSMPEQFYHGDDNIEYHLKWIEGAKSAHNLTIDCEPPAFG